MTDVVLEAARVADLSESEANSLTFKITLMRDSLIEGYDKLVRLVTEAYERRAWSALGFGTWDDYAREKLQLDLGRDDRKQFTIALAEAGLSSRAIAPVVQVTDRQVRNEVGNHFPPLERPDVQGIDGKSYQPPTPRTPRRRPLPDAFKDAVWDLTKTIDRLDRLVQDDRFPANRKSLNTDWWRALNSSATRLFEIEQVLWRDKASDDDEEES